MTTTISLDLPLSNCFISDLTVAVIDRTLLPSSLPACLLSATPTVLFRFVSSLISSAPQGQVFFLLPFLSPPSLWSPLSLWGQKSVLTTIESQFASRSLRIRKVGGKLPRGLPSYSCVVCVEMAGNLKIVIVVEDPWDNFCLYFRLDNWRS
jgi:hypothetical protein